jgi:hypothetical protein
LVELVQAHPDLGDEGAALLEPGVAVTRRTTPGGAGPIPVATQMERFGRRLDVDRARVRLLPGSRIPEGAHGGQGKHGPDGGQGKHGAEGGQGKHGGTGASGGKGARTA